MTQDQLQGTKRLVVPYLLLSCFICSLDSENVHMTSEGHRKFILLVVPGRAYFIILFFSFFLHRQAKCVGKKRGQERGAYVLEKREQ